jgi:hypothetical protein
MTLDITILTTYVQPDRSYNVQMDEETDTIKQASLRNVRKIIWKC